MFKKALRISWTLHFPSYIAVISLFMSYLYFVKVIFTVRQALVIASNSGECTLELSLKWLNIIYIVATLPFLRLHHTVFGINIMQAITDACWRPVRLQKEAALDAFPLVAATPVGVWSRSHCFLSVAFKLCLIGKWMLLKINNYVPVPWNVPVL